MAIYKKNFFNNNICVVSLKSFGRMLFLTHLFLLLKLRFSKDSSSLTYWKKLKLFCASFNVSGTFYLKFQSHLPVLLDIIQICLQGNNSGCKCDYLHLIYKMRIFGTYYSNIYGPTTMLNVSNPTLYYLGGSKSLIYNFYEPLFCRVESLAIKMLLNNKLIASNTKTKEIKLIIMIL